MAINWSVNGEYMEACSCDFLCPCIPKNSTTPATYDYCKVALAFDITDGSYGDTSLAGVRFVMIAQSKAIMSEGDWIAGLVIDTSASDAQVEAVAAICSAEGGGPLGGFAPLISDFRGVERHAIEFERDGDIVRTKIDGLLDQEIEGVLSNTVPGEYVCIDNAGHPVNKRLNFASAIKNVINAFGIQWEGTPNQTNGHFAPFAWQGTAA